MELSPEEQRRIYLKEKTTFEGRQLQAARSAKKKSGRLKWLLLIIVGLMILATFLDDNNKPSSPKTAAQLETETEAKAAQVKYDACNVRLQKAKELDMLQNISEKAAGIQVLVGPTYFDVPIERQKGVCGSRQLCVDQRER